MCGIVGAVWPDGAEPGVLLEMTRRLSHRGPDDEQTWVDADVGLGVRRLSIMDPEGGRQPFVSHDGGAIAVINGEIYNHVALRHELSSAGHRFHTGSDAEVLPPLYQEHGPAFVERLRGEFALAVYDTSSRRLLLARDPLGVKPLYFLEVEGGIWFGSEMKSLLLAPGFVPRVDRHALDLLMAFKHIPGDATLLAGVRLLRPGHRLVYDVARGTAADSPYYAIPDRPVAVGFDDAAAEVTRRLDDAVAARLMSDVPLGVALSGGLDSSSVVASVARQTGKGPRTFSVYVGDRVNELHWARLVADRYRTEHTEIVVEPERLDEVVPRILWHLEEPMSISEIPTWYLGRAVGGNVKVLLCGEGADETFGGYKRFLPLAAAPWLPPSVLTWGYLRGINGLTRRDRRRLYAPAQRHGMVGNSNVWLDRALTEGTGPTLNRFLRYELRHQLRSQVLRLDKLTMAHGVEARCPFLDPVLVDYVANLPPQFKVRGLREKVLLKAAMRDRLPKAVVERRKFGMANPVATLFRGGFRDICRDALHDRSDILAPYFDLEAVDALFDQVGRYPVWYRIPEQQLFHIYLFLKWHEVFIEGRLPTGVEGEAMVPRRNVAGPAPLAEATSTA